jgi:hypothetical protein
VFSRQHEINTQTFGPVLIEITDDSDTGSSKIDLE